MLLQHDVPLGPLTTLKLGGRARRMALVGEEEEVVEALRDAEAKGEQVLVLGGGSNVVIADAGFDGLVLRIASRGVRMELEDGGVRVEAAAGEDWEPLVQRCVEAGYSGFECLSGIPGLVGATPIQNVGAYGQEVSDTIVSVRVYDRELQRLVDMAPASCAFGYRQSVFRHNPRFVVMRVAFFLRKSTDSAPVRYAELSRALGIGEGETAPVPRVRQAVLSLRHAKGMLLDAGDPDSVSVGSFFVNPTLDADALARLERRVAETGALRVGETLPRFPAAGGTWKVSAGWLVERAGFPKGFAAGRVGVSGKHALALVHHGHGSTADLLALARSIRDGVRVKFGVEISPEPVLVGCSLDP